MRVRTSSILPKEDKKRSSSFMNKLGEILKGKRDED
jgi:hypothetical protein